MSFTRSFSFHVSGDVSYPASEHGGSVSYHDSVNVVVEVDTSAFDASVMRCASSVGNLAGTVSSGANMLEREKRESANRISASLVDGFYQYVLYGVRETLMRLGTRIPMLLQALKAFAGRCIAAREQLGKDYQQITGRYAMIFTDLDNALKGALTSLDGPAFEVVNMATGRMDQALLGESTAVALTTGPEEASSTCSVEVAKLKVATQKTIQECARNIRYNKYLSNQIDHILVASDGQGEHSILMPVVELLTHSLDGQDYREVSFHLSSELPSASYSAVYSALADAADNESAAPSYGLDDGAKGKVDQFFKRRLSDSAAEIADIERRDRLVSNVMRMWGDSLAAMETQR